jgi:hypothetical protein
MGEMRGSQAPLSEIGVNVPLAFFGAGFEPRIDLGLEPSHAGTRHTDATRKAAQLLPAQKAAVADTDSHLAKFLPANDDLLSNGIRHCEFSIRFEVMKKRASTPPKMSQTVGKIEQRS